MYFFNLSGNDAFLTMGLYFAGISVFYYAVVSSSVVGQLLQNFHRWWEVCSIL